MFNLGLSLMGGAAGSILAKFLKTYDYTPTWVSNFSILPQDSNGWSEIPQPADTARVMYVRSVENGGDDATAEIYTGASFADSFSPSSEKAYATVNAAVANMRSGFADYVLIHSGDVIPVTARIDLVKGESATNLSVIATYGGLSRAELFHDMADIDHSVFRGWQSGGSYTGVFNLKITHPRKDPNHASFAGWSNIIWKGSGLSFYVGGVGEVTGTHVEGCLIEHFGTAISFSTGENGTFNNIVLYRNIAYRSYKSIDGGHPQGFGLGDGSYYVKENMFDRCGWYDAVGTTSPRSSYSHSCYSIHVHDSIYENNISIDPCSMHFKFTADVGSQNLSTALTGASETSITVDINIPINMKAIGGKIGVITDSGATIEIIYDSFSGNTFSIPPTDFSIDNASIGKKVYSLENFIGASNVVMNNNLLIQGEIVSRFGGNLETYTKDYPAQAYRFDKTGQRFSDFRFQGNVCTAIGSTSDIGWGANPDDCLDAIISENMFMPVGNETVNNIYPVTIEGSSLNSLVMNNRMYGMGDIKDISLNPSSHEIYSNTVDANAIGYVNAEASIPEYMIANGLGSDIADFSLGCVNQSKQSWNSKYTAGSVQEYFKKAVAIEDGFIVLNDVVDITAIEGQDIAFTYDIVTNARTTGQWYYVDGNTPIAGETGATLTIPNASSATHEGLRVYCQRVEDLTGELYTSSIGTASVTTATFVTFNGIDDYAADEINIINLVAGKDWYVETETLIPISAPTVETLWTLGDTGNSASRYLCLTLSSTIEGSFKIETAGFTPGETASLFNDGSLHTTIISYNSASNLLTLTVDGVDEYSVTPSSLVPVEGDKYLYIGARTNGLGDNEDQYFNGSYSRIKVAIDEGGASENIREFTLTSGSSATEGSTELATTGVGEITYHGTGLTGS